ncbi:MAG: hypothetical protein ABI361_09705 [Nitrososphaera sp.]|jgi:hypothetical protein
MVSYRRGGAGGVGSSGTATAVLIQVLESDELYARQRERKLSAHDIRLINEYVAKLPRPEWEAFEAHCVQNELDPLKEMRELILATYMRNFVLGLKRRQREDSQA